jgi:2-aminoethylphosphonate-pyruvate transaminase
MNIKDQKISELIEKVNQEKPIFTAGPASLVFENVAALKNCFGRGDKDYDLTENEVLEMLMKMSGHSKIARLQGSASLALEIMINNFAYGKVLIVDSGYYSERLDSMAKSAQKIYRNITEIHNVDCKDLDECTGNYDWIISCYTETSNATLIPILKLRSLADRTSSKLMIDATASIGLEANHELSDVMAYSSCKGLFGLTGASFISFNEMPANEVNSFYLNLENHLNRKMTGPYHSICSLHYVLKNHDFYKEAVLENKKRFLSMFDEWLILPAKYQPNLCTYISCKVKATNSKTILYYPRSLKEGSVVCHLGEVYLGNKAKGNILKNLEVCSE